MSEKSAKPTMGRRVLAASSSLLAAFWIVALASIPSAQSYRDQLAAGTPAEQIITAYDALAVIITITMLFAWITTGIWLRRLHISATAVNPTAMRLKKPWAFWSWITPVVSLWFPKLFVDDLLKANGSEEAKSFAGKDSLIWWLTLGSSAFLLNLAVPNPFGLDGETPADFVPIRPDLHLAAAFLLTGSYLVWIRIVKTLDR